MAGKTQPQTTAAAPAPALSAPSAPPESNATGTPQTSTPPPAPVEKASKAEKKAPPPKAQLAPAPENAKDTSEQTRIEFEAKVRKLEEGDRKDQEGKAEKGKEEALAPKAKENDKAEKVDSVQAEIDAAAAAEKLEVKKPEVEKPKDEKTETEEVEPPDPESSGDEYDKWLNSLSKPAKKRLETYRAQLAKSKATAADRITVQPTIERPLTHVTTLEQLDHEKQYWTNIEKQAEAGGSMIVLDANGKKVELDQDEHADQIERYKNWAKSALSAVPDTKEFLLERNRTKPWDAAEKLVPGLITDKDSNAAKLAIEFLQSNPSIRQMPDFEVHLAHMVRSKQMEEDAKPTDAYPKGKAKWVRLPLDKEGKVIPPKAAVAKEATKKPPTANDSKPLVHAEQSSTDITTLRQKAETSGDPDDFKAFVRAKERLAQSRAA